MPNPKQGQPQDRQNGGNAGGAMASAREQLHGVADRIGEGTAHVGERLHDGLDATREELGHRYRQAEGMIARHPGQSVLVGFGVGFGLGVLLTVLLTRREEDSWYDRYVPDSLRHIPDRLRHLHVPDSIARHMPGH